MVEKAGSRIMWFLLLIMVASCSAPPPPSHPAGELYLQPPAVPEPQPSTENDINGGAN